MSASPPDPVESLLGELLRHPEPLRDPGVERALRRLTAARSDASYLLMHRVLVLESALAQVRQVQADGTVGSRAGGGPQPDGAMPAEPVRPQRATAPARSFLRDAAVVAAGVLAGTALAQGVASVIEPDPAGARPEADADADADWDLGLGDLI